MIEQPDHDAERDADGDGERHQVADRRFDPLERFVHTGTVEEGAAGEGAGTGSLTESRQDLRIGLSSSCFEAGAKAARVGTPPDARRREIGVG